MCERTPKLANKHITKPKKKRNKKLLEEEELKKKQTVSYTI